MRKCAKACEKMREGRRRSEKVHLLKVGEEQIKDGLLPRREAEDMREVHACPEGDEGVEISLGLALHWRGRGGVVTRQRGIAILGDDFGLILFE